MARRNEENKMSTVAQAPAKAGEKEDKFAHIMVDIENSGTKIILPEKMTPEEGVKALQRKIAADETIVNVYHSIEAFPLDAAYAFKKAIDRIYGHSNPVPPSFFSQGTTFVAVTIGMDDHGNTESVQVPWGPVNIPGIEGELQAAADMSNGMKFIIAGKAKKKHQDAIHKLYKLTEQIVRTESIYRGKATRISFQYKDDGRPFNPIDDAPKFIDLGKVNVNQLVFPKATLRQLNAALFNPIIHADKMRANNVPLKRGILLAGPYGTGKTLTSNVTAKHSVNSGFTFFYLTNVVHLAECLRLAQLYQPAVIFSEDIDRVMNGQERTVEIDEILNTIDGVDTKNLEVITVLTTNHLEDITLPMLRPGRLDAIISLQLPDPECVVQLISMYGREHLSPDADLHRVGEMLAGQIPATIKETMDRAKVFALTRHSGDPRDTKGIVTQEDLETASEMLINQQALVKAPKEPPHPLTVGLEAMGGAMGTKLGQEVARSLDRVGEATMEIYKLRQQSIETSKVS
jgi:transitional endoplasmic reticulum ATPase